MDIVEDTTETGGWLPCQHLWSRSADSWRRSALELLWHWEPLALSVWPSPRDQDWSAEHGITARTSGWSLSRGHHSWRIQVWIWHRYCSCLFTLSSGDSGWLEDPMHLKDPKLRCLLRILMCWIVLGSRCLICQTRGCGRGVWWPVWGSSRGSWWWVDTTMVSAPCSCLSRTPEVTVLRHLDTTGICQDGSMWVDWQKYILINCKKRKIVIFQERKWGFAFGYIGSSLAAAGGGDYGDETVDVLDHGSWRRSRVKMMVKREFCAGVTVPSHWFPECQF